MKEDVVAANLANLRQSISELKIKSIDWKSKTTEEWNKFSAISSA